MASSNIARLGVVLALDTALFTAAVQEAINTNVKLKSSIQRESRAAEKEIQSLKYAMEDYGKEVSKVTQVERELESGRFKSLKGTETAQRLLEQARAYDQIAKSSKSVTQGLTEQQKLALTYQTTDLVTQIASGQNAMIALMQQGGQLKDQMGGLGNMFRVLGTFITPVNVALAATAVTVGGLAVAAYQGAQEQSKFRNEIALTGNYANITYNQFLQLADSISTKFNVSVGGAKDILQQLVSTGNVTGPALQSVASAIATISRFSGETASEVAKKMIPAFMGGASSIKEMNDRMNFLTLEQFKHIMLLDKQGKNQEAATIAADAFNKKMKDQQDNLGYLQSAWDKLGKAASWAWNAMMGLGREDKGADRAKELEKLINQMVANIEANAERLKTNPELLKQREQKLADMRLELAQIVAKETTKIEEDEKARKAKKDIKDLYENGQKRIQLASEIEKQAIKNAFELASYSANEVEKIELDAMEKKLLAKKEMQLKDEIEGRKFAGENARLLAQQEIQIEQDKQQKLRELNKKRYIDDFNARQEYAQSIKDEMANEVARKQAIAGSMAFEQNATKKNLELEMQKAQLRQQMVGSSETALQIALLELETNRKILDIKENIDLTDSDKAVLIRNTKFNQGMQEMIISMQDALKKTEQVYDAVFGNMERALENFVRTGKLSFKDLARSIIQDLILIQLKASATSLFRMFMGSIGFGSSSGALPSVTGQFGVGPTGFANGGNPPVGRASIVGERGPELFVPRTAGTIIPNNALSSLGGSQVVNNYNIQAIDVKSFEDRIMGSSTAVWAANAYANKSLAIGRGRA